MHHAFLWVPPASTNIRGVVMGGMTLMERACVMDPQIRQACREAHLALMFLKCGLGRVNVQQVLDGFAGTSGYAELSQAPLFFIGHSAGGPQAKACAIRFASRCFGLVLYRGGVPGGASAVPPGVPVLMMIGQFDEFGKTMRNAAGRETWMGGRDALTTYRALHPRHLACLLVEPGAGHFAWSQGNARFLAQFLKRAASACLPVERAPDPAKPPKLRRLDERRGWLTDPAVEKPVHPAAPWDEYAGDRSSAVWHFDADLARASEAYHQGLTGRQDQFIRWQDPHWVDAGARFFFTRIEWVGDGQTLAVHPVYAHVYPSPQQDGRGPHWFRAGQPVGHSSVPIQVRPVSGPLALVKKHQLRIRFNSLTPATEKHRATFLACSPGDADFRYTEQVGMLPRGFRGLTKGKAQIITFPQPDDLHVNGKPVRLRAQSDAGLPVQCYVAYGPGRVEDGCLHIQDLPCGAVLPVRVAVTAWQFGRGLPPLVRTAEPVTRLLWIRPSKKG